MQSNPSLSQQTKHSDHVPIRENDYETEAKAPDISVSKIAQMDQFSDQIPQGIDEQLAHKFKTHDFMTYSHLKHLMMNKI